MYQRNDTRNSMNGLRRGDQPLPDHRDRRSWRSVLRSGHRQAQRAVRQPANRPQGDSAPNVHLQAHHLRAGRVAAWSKTQSSRAHNQQRRPLRCRRRVARSVTEAGRPKLRRNGAYAKCSTAIDKRSRQNPTSGQCTPEFNDQTSRRKRCPKPVTPKPAIFATSVS
jgi:hypothetical protein